MKIFPIATTDFLDSEKSTLEHLRKTPSCWQLAAAATKALSTLGSDGYTFTATWPVLNGRGVLDITVAVCLQINNDEFEFLSYVLTVAEENKTSKTKTLLRKYHYDYECKEKEKPAFHLQYGGQPLPSHDNYDGTTELAPWLSEPRLFYTPMSLALLLEQAFLEFPDESTLRVQKDSFWGKHVLRSQAEILHPYFERCCQKIVNNERLYSECYI